MEERTSLVVAHRLSTIQRCDRILVFHHGELRETGTHYELIKQKGLYWRLFQLQYGNKTGTDVSEINSKINNSGLKPGFAADP
jgi:ATP-binding cassette subfamily B protein